MITFTDRCLSQISAGIAAYEPEVGGALLKLPDTNIVCEFVADPDAHTSAASYLPSPGLTDIVRSEEKRQSLQFAGIIHSHPGSMSEPSGQDHRAFALSLALNPHLSAFIAPIVTIPDPYRPLEPHQHALEPRGTMTVHTCYRRVRGADISPVRHTDPPLADDDPLLDPFQEPESRVAAPRRSFTSLLPSIPQGYRRKGDPADPRNDGVDIYHPPIGIMTLDQDIAFLAASLEGQVAEPLLTSDISYGQINGTPTINVSLSFESLHLLCFLAPGYPFTPPLALLSPVEAGQTKDAVQLQFAWPIGTHETRLLALADAAIAFCEKNPDHFAQRQNLKNSIRSKLAQIGGST